MAIQFSKAFQLLYSTESHREHVYEHLIAGTVETITTGQVHILRGIAIDSETDLIYVVEAVPPRVSIFSMTGAFISTFSNEHMKDPWGVAIYRDNIYVTDLFEHFVFHFKVSVGINLVAKAGGKGSEFGQFDKPRQLIVSTKGEIFISDQGNNRVQILNSDLEYVRHISHHSMTLPCDVILTSVEIYVLSCSSPCVHIFTIAGQKLRSLITWGVGMQVTNSYFFCLDANENFIISDRDAHNIKIFSNEGTLLQTLGERGHNVGLFYYPNGIAITKDRKLVVLSWHYECSLQIFSL